jgi:adenine-specific DNA-methyltransferase
MSFDVPTLPLFIHERLSTKAILETLKGHKRDKQMDMAEMFGDPRHSIADQVMRAYEYPDPWVNRMILGDSLVVMNSLLRYEGLGGQVQMIYIDPPYGVKFGSNFQPFVRKRDVSHNDDEDMTREPEMVQAYRDTWELGLHSYLTYLRDRLVLGRELLSPSGSMFVQISDENLHHVRELMDDTFGSENLISQITFMKTSGAPDSFLGTASDYMLWYGRDHKRTKFNPVFLARTDKTLAEQFRFVELPDKSITRADEVSILESGEAEAGKRFMPADLTGQGTAGNQEQFSYGGRTFSPTAGRHWSTTPAGLAALEAQDRLFVIGDRLSWKRYLADFQVTAVNNVWFDTAQGGRAVEKIYVVQTATKAVERCVLMTTDPGDLVLDPTCGSGTTAYVAEQWGRRWITIDTSRVPLALARQRLLTATFPWYELKDEARGPVGGFSYERKQTNKGEEVGGIVPHVTLKSIANNEPPAEEVLVDRPEVDNKVTRITGRFCFEATIPTPMDWEGAETKPSSATPDKDADLTFVDRMIEVLRKSPVLRLEGNRTVTLKNVRPPAKSLSLSAEALVDATAPGQKPTLEDAVQEAREKNGSSLAFSAQPVAFVFGPENGAVNEGLVYSAAKEAFAKKLLASLRHRIRHPAHRPRTDREMRPDRRHSRNLRASHARPDDGRPAQEHAI